jgi:hypothetical protein
MKVKAIAWARIKSDKVDAHILAHLLRVDFIPEVKMPDEKHWDLRQLISSTVFSQVSSYKAHTFNGRSDFQISSINPADATKAVLQQCEVHNTAQVCARNLSITSEGSSTQQPWLVSTYNKAWWDQATFTLASVNPGDAIKGVIAGCMSSNNTFQVCVRNLSATQISGQ